MESAEGFFDTIDHDRLMRAVELHVKEPWIRLYVRRWLTCPVQVQDGTVQQRDRGTPQGGVISPLLANLFLHDVFDAWMLKHHSDVPFERSTARVNLSVGCGRAILRAQWARRYPLRGNPGGEAANHGWMGLRRSAEQAQQANWNLRGRSVPRSEPSGPSSAPASGLRTACEIPRSLSDLAKSLPVAGCSARKPHSNSAQALDADLDVLARPSPVR